MKVISSAELCNNMEKYLDLAGSETVVIQRGRDETFVLQKKEFAPEFEISEDIPEDFHRAITVEEAKIRVRKGLREMFKMKQEQKANKSQ
jgi:hypothetical protein